MWQPYCRNCGNVIVETVATLLPPVASRVSKPRDTPPHLHGDEEIFGDDNDHDNDDYANNDDADDDGEDNDDDDDDKRVMSSKSQEAQKFPSCKPKDAFCFRVLPSLTPDFSR